MKYTKEERLEIGMFSDLEKFLDESFSAANKRAIIYTPDNRVRNYDEFEAVKTSSSAALSKDYKNPAAPEECSNILTLVTPSDTAGINIIVSFSLLK